MLERLRHLEASLIRLEARVMVALVLLMLGLASYNVLYRNLLVPLQKHWATSGPVVEPGPAPDMAPAIAAPSASAVEDALEGGDDAGGFGGGFGDEPPAPAAGDDAGGFGGGFEDPPAGAEEKAGDDAGGFGGGFGDEPGGAGDDAGGFGGGFGDEPAAATDADVDAEAVAGLETLVATQEVDAPPPPEDTDPVGGPPPAGSFAAQGVAFVDAIKLDWIDIFLRQLVILVSFFGAALATRRRKHINIDAVSKALPDQTRRGVGIAVNLLSLAICLVLASAGWDLVDLGLEYPKELVPWAEEWVFQLMFPAGFGLLALHFVVRLLESADAFRRREDVQ